MGAPYGGSTGRALALWLARLGVGLRIIDKVAEPGTTSRAVAMQARTLELYRQAGLSDAVLESGRNFTAREPSGAPCARSLAYGSGTSAKASARFRSP